MLKILADQDMQYISNHIYGTMIMYIIQIIQFHTWIEPGTNVACGALGIWETCNDWVFPTTWVCVVVPKYTNIQMHIIHKGMI